MSGSPHLSGLVKKVYYTRPHPLVTGNPKEWQPTGEGTWVTQWPGRAAPETAPPQTLPRATGKPKGAQATRGSHFGEHMTGVSTGKL